MTAPNATTLTAEELREWAPLDAFGLLDEQEVELFEKSFHSAPAAVQDEIRDLQAELVTEADALSAEEPPAELRTRTIERVTALAAREADRNAPAGAIGTDADRPRRRDPMPLSGYFWRAATFVLAATGVLLLLVSGWMNHERNKVTEWALTGFTSQQIQQEIGPDFTDFLFSDETQRYVFTSADGADGREQAALFVNDQTGEAFLICDNLPIWAEDDSKARYSLTLITEDGRREEIRRFETTGSITAVRLDVPAGALSQANWEITGPGSFRLTTA